VHNTNNVGIAPAPSYAVKMTCYSITWRSDKWLKAKKYGMWRH